jgi:hypothetical protein
VRTGELSVVQDSGEIFFDPFTNRLDVCEPNRIIGWKIFMAPQQGSVVKRMCVEWPVGDRVNALKGLNTSRWRACFFVELPVLFSNNGCPAIYV